MGIEQVSKMSSVGRNNVLLNMEESTTLLSNAKTKILQRDHVNLVERLTPKPSTIKALFAKSGNECAFPGCHQPLVDDLNLFVGEVCHINSVNDAEARHDPSLNAEQLRAYENLILLCHPHHIRIDSVADAFPVQVLKEMREQHERRLGNSSYPVPENVIDDALLSMLESEWEPYFEPVIEYLMTDVVTARGGQQGMNLLTNHIGELLDAKLYILTVRALSTVSLPERHKIISEFDDWKNERHRRSEKASRIMRGGSGAPLLYNSTYNEITEKRIEYLRKHYLKQEDTQF